MIKMVICIVIFWILFNKRTQTSSLVYCQHLVLIIEGQLMIIKVTNIDYDDVDVINLTICMGDE